MRASKFYFSSSISIIFLSSEFCHLIHIFLESGTYQLSHSMMLFLAHHEPGFSVTFMKTRLHNPGKACSDAHLPHFSEFQLETTSESQQTSYYP